MFNESMKTALKLAHELKELTGETCPVEIKEAVAILSDCLTGQGPDDVELMGFRFIRNECLDDIMQDELSSDTYTLGCFNAWFLADILPIDEGDVEAIQEAGAHEALGKMVVNGGYLGELQSKYAGSDGYGHHFGHYDGEEYDIYSVPYTAFKVN